MELGVFLAQIFGGFRGPNVSDEVVWLFEENKLDLPHKRTPEPGFKSLVTRGPGPGEQRESRALSLTAGLLVPLLAALGICPDSLGTCCTLLVSPCLLSLPDLLGSLLQPLPVVGRQIPLPPLSCQSLLIWSLLEFPPPPSCPPPPRHPATPALLRLSGSVATPGFVLSWRGHPMKVTQRSKKPLLGGKGRG